MDQSPLDLRDHLSLLWRQRWVILAVTSAALAGALLYSFSRTPLYASSSEVVVRSARLDATVGPPVVNMNTEVQVANSARVAELAERGMAEGGGAEVSAALVPDSETLEFTATSPDPQTAQTAAQSYAEAYLELRRRDALTELDAARQPRLSRIQQIDEEVAQIEKSLAVTTSETQRVLLNARLGSLLSEKSLVSQELSRLASPEAIRVGEVIRPAPLPRSPSSPDRVRNGLLGFVIGLSLGVGFAYIRDRLDQRVWGEEELEARSGAPVLAGIPVGTPLQNDLPAAASDPASELAEAYNALRLRILRVAEERDARVVVVTSSLAREGKTSVVANLGTAIAETGKRVAIVSGDLRRPELQSFFPSRRRTGLTQVLAGNRKLPSVLSSTHVKNLYVVHAGTLSASSSPVDLLSSHRMREMIRDLRRSVDFVLIDTPPLLATYDAAAVAGFADGVLFVADPRLASRTDVEQARRELELSGAPLLGVVVNRYDRRGFRPYSYHYETPDGSSARTRRPLEPGLQEDAGVTRDVSHSPGPPSQSTGEPPRDPDASPGAG